MALLAKFLREVLQAGRLVVRGPLPWQTDADAAPVLADAYQQYALQVAGPPIVYDRPTALAAARVLYQAGWYLLNSNEPVAASHLRMSADPRTAAQHLSADLLFRYLPAVHRRARALRHDDELAAALTNLLRRWPLSGVMADIAEEPLTPTDFDGHPGLCMLYAERLARHEKAAWLPTGRAIEAVELVWHDLGRDARVLGAMPHVASERVNDA